MPEDPTSTKNGGSGSPNEALDPEPGVLPRAIRHRGLGALAEADAVGAAVASALELAERSSDVASLRGSDALAGPSPDSLISASLPSPARTAISISSRMVVVW